MNDELIEVVGVTPTLETAEDMVMAVDWREVRENRLRLVHKPYQGDPGDEAS